MAWKPADDPRFFLLPPPDRGSRESSLRLDAEGSFTQDGEPVTHGNLLRALHGWIGRHPVDGRFILSNGHDWVYFTVEDAPYQARHLIRESNKSNESDGELKLWLSDDTEEPWDPATSWIGANAVIYARVKSSLAGGPFVARFSRRAQQELAPYLEERDGQFVVRIGGRAISLAGPSSPSR